MLAKCDQGWRLKSFGTSNLAYPWCLGFLLGRLRKDREPLFSLPFSDQFKVFALNDPGRITAFQRHPGNVVRECDPVADIRVPEFIGARVNPLMLWEKDGAGEGNRIGNSFA